MRVITADTQRTRKQRRPNFPMAGVLKPYGLYPLWAHPVLPGETMDAVSVKYRVLSKPVKHPLAGAWLETWLVYVKLTDLDRNLGEMFISDSYSTTGWTAAADAGRYFVKTGQIDWIRRCTQRVHDCYFLNDGETARTIDGVRQVKLSNLSWTQNLMFQPAGVNEANLPSNPDAQLSGFQMMQMMTMSELTYEKYLEQFGVQSIRAETGEPEILRYTRSWVQPVNTVEPTTGTPSSAWVWSEEVKSDKPKRFDEPGFILHLCSIRPKMYQRRLDASFVGNLWGFSDWFPVYNLDAPEGGVRSILASDQAFKSDWATGNTSQKLLYDHRDLLNHGEQFVNEWSGPYALPASTGLVGTVGASPEDVRGEYATAADIAALFSSATAADQFLYYEGMAMPVINGHITDTTLR